MASLKSFVLKPGRSQLCINMAIRTLTSNSSSSPATRNQRHQFHHSEDLGNRIYTGMNKSSSSKLTSGFPGIFSLVPAALAGFFGAGMFSYTDANEVDSQTPPLSESPSSLPESPLVLPKSSEPLAETPPVAPPSAYEDLEKIVKQERERLEELLKSRGMRYGSYPRFTVAMKGQKVSVKFQIPSTCEMSHMIVDLASNLGLKLEQPGGGSEMILRVWNSSVAWQLTLNHPEVKKGDLGDTVTSESKKGHQGSLCVLIYQSLISLDNAEIEFIKQGSFSTKELDAFVSALKLAASQMGLKRSMTRRPREYLDIQDNDTQKSVAALESMGVRIIGLNATHENSSVGKVSWDNIAGYHEQKREVEDTILLSLHSPKVYDDIARGTRRIFESNRPRAVLFEGPPGTGKTSCARVIANQAGVPLLYVPLEAVMSKYYGESERLFGKVFSLANELPGGAIIFLDEIDSFAATRDDGMHEATRRILSVLLRQIDGFEQEKKVVVIAATNRKEDLDPALISRFDSIITFGLPDQQTRQEIAAQYAKHLNSSELVQFAAITEEMSGRDIRDVCQQAERHWASKIIRGQASNEGEQCCLPPLQEYIDSAIYRKNALLSLRDKQSEVPRKKRRPMEFL